MAVLIDTAKINGVLIETEINFSPDGKEIREFPVLYKIDKLKRSSWWRIYTIGSTIYRESGIEGGVIKKYTPSISTGKNIGRSNETTPNQQALFEAFSLWKHKHDQLYTVEMPSVGGGSVETSSGSRLRPMLAEKFIERKKYVTYPCAVSPKLDGVRCLVYLNGSKVMIQSRLGKIYHFLDGIRQDCRKLLETLPPQTVLDGELYSHTLPFNVITGAVKTKNKPSKHDNQIEFHIFDTISMDRPDMEYRERVAFFFKAETYQCLRFVTYEIVSTEGEVMAKHDEYVSAGYEGIMIRNLSSPYRIGRRVNDLLKYKQFEDREFIVIDVIDGKGSESLAAIFVCQVKNETFTVRPRGSIEKRKIQFLHKEKYIGKYLTVRYQPLTREDVLPRFPVGIKFDTVTEAIAIRDYE
jgi:DNA ligase-1